jgi:hypothetical protein
MRTEESSAASIAETPSDHLGHDATDAAAAPQEQREPLIEVLAKAGVASRDDLRVALAEGLRNGERLGEVVLRQGWIDPEGLARLIASQWNQPFLDDEGLELDPSVVAFLSADEARQLKACAIGVHGGVLSVVVAEPADARFAAVRSEVGREVAFSVVTRSTLDRLIDEAAALPVQARLAEVSDASGPTYDADGDGDDTESLLAALDRATSSLVALRERAEPLVRAQQQADHELIASREQVALLEGALAEAREASSRLEAELEAEREMSRRLEEELTQQRDRFADVKAKLVDVSRTLGES